MDIWFETLRPHCDGGSNREGKLGIFKFPTHHTKLVKLFKWQTNGREPGDVWGEVWSKNISQKFTFITGHGSRGFTIVTRRLSFYNRPYTWSGRSKFTFYGYNKANKKEEAYRRKETLSHDCGKWVILPLWKKTLYRSSLWSRMSIHTCIYAYRWFAKIQPRGVREDRWFIWGNIVFGAITFTFVARIKQISRAYAIEDINSTVQYKFLSVKRVL